MRKFLLTCSVLVMAGCTSTPDKYAAGLPESDPKYNTPECKDIRLKALDFDNKVGQRMLIGAGAGLLLGPFGLPLAMAADAEREDARKAFAREIHMRCSSKPLPANLVPKPKMEQRDRDDN